MTKIHKVGSECTVDSMQIRIPVSDLSCYSESLTENTYLVTPSGEVIDELTNNRKHRIGDKGLSLQIKGIRHAGRENVDCLVIGAPSKILGSRYFDGITQETFQVIYDAIIGSGIVDVSMDALFGAGMVTDFDVKQDSYFPRDMDFSKYCYHLKKHARPTTEIGKGCKVYNNANDGQGIQFGTRKTATAAYPFLKLYNKARELHTKSLPFMQSYLPEYDVTGLVRVEATVKNRQQFTRILGMSDNTLTNVLSLSSGELEQFISHAQKVHIDKITAYRKKEVAGYTGKDLTMYRLLSMLLDTGASFGEVSETLLQGREKQDKWRTKKLITDMFHSYLDAKENALESTSEGLGLFGW